ncbi:hypothetical protein C8R45DRAFT_196978 [Mycena sanguinolenta]|nr:hypothetical protein C8R45DRAFT_196978 [Mycena sanguinolenta]
MPAPRCSRFDWVLLVGFSLGSTHPTRHTSSLRRFTLALYFHFRSLLIIMFGHSLSCVSLPQIRLRVGFPSPSVAIYASSRSHQHNPSSELRSDSHSLEIPGLQCARRSRRGTFESRGQRAESLFRCVGPSLDLSLSKFRADSLLVLELGYLEDQSPYVHHSCIVASGMAAPYFFRSFCQSITATSLIFTRWSLLAVTASSKRKGEY